MSADHAKTQHAIAIVNELTSGLYDRVYAQLPNGDSTPVPLDELLERTARRYLMQVNDPHMIAETKAPQAMTIAAQSIDKMRLMRELSTDTIRIVLQLTESFQARGIPASDAFAAMLQETALIPKASEQ